MFFTIYPSGDSVVSVKYINNWIDVIREIYFETHDSIFQLVRRVNFDRHEWVVILRKLDV